MAEEKKKVHKVIRSAYVQKCLESNELFTLFFGPEDKNTVLELPKTWFRGVGCPKKGSKITLIQDGTEVTMLINNKQFYPSLNPLSIKDIPSRKCK